MPRARKPQLAILPFDNQKTRIAKTIINLHRLRRIKTREDKATFNDLSGLLANEMAQAFANPLYDGTILSDMVEVRIPAEITQEERSLIDAMSDEDYDALVRQKGGDQAALVEGSLIAWDCAFCGPILEEDYVSFHMRCDNHFASRICALLYIDYAHEIRRGEILVERWLIAPRFFDLADVRGAVDYLKRERKKTKNKE